MNVSVFIARHIGVGSKDGQRNSSSSTIAVVGTALSMAIMILAITVVTGFKSQIREKVLNTGASITVTAPEAYDEFGRCATPAVGQSDLAKVTDALGGDYSVTMAMTQSGVLKTANDFLGLEFEAFGPTHDWSTIATSIVDGELPDFNNTGDKYTVVLSKTSADKLGLTAGDKIDAYFFADDNIKARRLTVKGIYDTHFTDYDNAHCFVPLPTLQRIAGLDSLSGSRIEITSVPTDSIMPLTERLDQTLYGEYLADLADGDTRAKRLKVDNVLNSGAAYLNWLDLLDTNVVVIIALMAAVSGFTLVSCLFILILERVRLIGSLKSMGATNRQISRIFIYLAERIVLKGMAIGNAIGLGLAALQWYFKLLPLDASAYYLTAVPVKIELSTLALLNVGMLLFSTAILLIPARMVAGISPASTMKYE